VREDSSVRALADLRGAVCAVNGFNSYSGTGSLRALVAPLSRDGRFFDKVKVSGAHVRSIEMVRAGEADVAAIDCVTYALLRRYRPQSLAGTRILQPTDPVPPPPYVTSRDYPPETVARLQNALVSVLDRTPRLLRRPLHCWRHSGPAPGLREDPRPGRNRPRPRLLRNASDDHGPRASVARVSK
jgi:ABC-type phosphate/phosphonate transport system substrate-binding protein